MAEQTTTETRDERANRLLHLGLQVAASIREEPADAVARLISHLDWSELRDMALLLAAAVPVDMPVSVLMGWYTHPRPQLRPCGTLAAARRHRARGEPLDPLCEHAERETERVRHRNQRAAKREAA